MALRAFAFVPPVSLNESRLLVNQTINPFAPRTVVSMSDPALEMTEEQRAAYRDKLDPKLLQAKDGAKPVEFEIEPADAVWSALNISDSSRADSKLIAFRACCRGININGTVHKPTKTENLGGVQVAGDDWLRTAMGLVGAYRVMEIGMRCASISMLNVECVDPLLRAGGAVHPS